MPLYEDRLEGLRAAGTLLAHYTSAANALRIIRDKRVTLRNALLMNDFSEIDHGEKCVSESWQSAEGVGNQHQTNGRLRSLLSAISPTVVPAIEQSFNVSMNGRRLDTYLLSLGQHDDHKEGAIGKLSMWRAYGGKTNVAMVLNTDFLFEESSTGAFSAPAIYSYQKDFTQNFFRKFVDSIERNIEQIQILDRDVVVRWITHSLNILAMTAKHPGFEEEGEWRIIYAPWLHSSPQIKPAVLDISGVPQSVHYLSIDPTDPSVGTGVTLDNLLKKIIIGPTESPWILYRAFVTELEKAGISDAEKRVVVSDIPIRR